VIQETMRLYPPIWMLIRVAARPDVIDGKEIRVGDRIAMFAYGVGTAITLRHPHQHTLADQALGQHDLAGAVELAGQV
jgi:cytochrome P450